jgi:hypothetical protein
MKEFLTEHWLLVFVLFMYAMGFLNGYLNGRRERNDSNRYGNAKKLC